MRIYQNLSIRRKLTIPIVIIVLVLALVSIFISSYFLRKSFNEEKERVSRYKFENTDFVTNLISDKALAIASSISEIEIVKEAYQVYYQTSDIKKTQAILQSNFTEISNKITAETGLEAKIHFHLPPARSLLRCWNGTGGDELSDFRNTILQISKDHKPIMGIEVGRAGLVVRGLSPIFLENDSYAGSVEYILPFSEIKKHLIKGQNEEIGFYIRKEALTGINVFSSEYGENNSSRENLYHLFDKSSDNFADKFITEYIKNRQIDDLKAFEHEKNHFAIHTIKDYAGAVVGLVVFQHDMSDNITTERNSMLLLLAMIIVIAVFSLFLVVSLIEKNLVNPLKELQEVSIKHSLGDVSIPIKIQSKDEIGSLATAFKKLQSETINLIEKTKQIAAGNFEVEINERSEKDELSKSLNSMTKQLRESFQTQKQLLHKSEQASKDLKQIMNSTSAICAIDTNYGITKVNEAFCEMYDKSESELLGRKCYSIIDASICKNEKCVLKQITNGKDKIETELKKSLKNNKITDIRVSAIPMKDLQGNITGLVENIIDITKTVSISNSLHKRSEEIEKTNWIKTGQNTLNEIMRGDHNIVDLSREIITFLAKYSGAQIGTFYLVDDTGEELKLTGSYAFSNRKNLSASFKFGEGIIGQSAFEKEMINLIELPEDYMRIRSSLGNVQPKNLIVLPFIFEGRVLGVVELGSLEEFTEQQIDFLKSAMDNIAISINSNIAREQMKTLLMKTQNQAEELQQQQEELRVTNEELQEKAEELRASSEKLKNQQEELMTTNEELQEKTESLERQRSEIMKQNKLIEESRNEIEKKAEDLAIASKYKSEFLANMSHELRTPLNSLLILSQDLADNKKGNLQPKQVQSAEIIYKSGRDLLNLINEILDLSKIEAGKMTVNPQNIFLSDIKDSIFRNFQHQTSKKNIGLDVIIDNSLEPSIISDQQRIEQIIKNLLSNAIKFTQKGGITVNISKPDKNLKLDDCELSHDECIAISVTDTGIGIPKDKQKAIFEAFQQADGSTSRKFGGTGLGLSISRELSKLLGGELHLESEPGKGSTFTAILPVKLSSNIQMDLPKKIDNPKPVIAEPQKINTQKSDQIQSAHIEDDRDSISEKDRKLLVIEDDFKFAEILKQFCLERKFKFLHAGNGESGIDMAKQYRPDGIVLDIKLPGINGWEVLETIKDNPEIRHIPVHMMSGLEETEAATQKGAIGYLTKPVDKNALNEAFDRLENVNKSKIKKLLLVEKDDEIREDIIKLLKEDNLEITAVNTGIDAIKIIKEKHFDCMILNITLPDISGFDILGKMNADNDIQVPPVIIYTGKEITKEEQYELNKYTNSIIIKGDKSEERLLDETAIFLHQVVNDLPEEKQKIISNIHDKDAIFKDKKVLVVDDDMRNVFAVTHILEEKGIHTETAVNGQQALDKLEENSSYDLILMDIMMPVMDGYETMRKIREHAKYKDLKIIALTAKAMKSDREKCLEAGANDYLTKPLQIDRLLSLMRVWMY